MRLMSSLCDSYKKKKRCKLIKISHRMPLYWFLQFFSTHKLSSEGVNELYDAAQGKRLGFTDFMIFFHGFTVHRHKNTFHCSCQSSDSQFHDRRIHFHDFKDKRQTFHSSRQPMSLLPLLKKGEIRPRHMNVSDPRHGPL